MTRALNSLPMARLNIRELWSFVTWSMSRRRRSTGPVDLFLHLLRRYAAPHFPFPVVVLSYV